MSRTASVLLVIIGVLGVVAACAPDDRESQLEALARWEDRRLAPADSLAGFMASSDAVIRRAALRTAGLIGRTEALPAMIDRLENDSSQGVRAQAAFSLGLLGDSVALAPLTRALQDPHQSVRVAAIEGLAHQDHDGSALYGPALHGKPREARAAWTALRNVAGQASHDSLVAAIRAGLTRPEPEVRWRVLRCAERAPDSTLVEQVAAYVVDRNAQIRVHALRALSRQQGPAALEAVLRSTERHGRLRGEDRRRVIIAEMRAMGSLAGPILAGDPEGDHTSLAGRTTAAMVAGAQSEDFHVAEVALAAMTTATADLDLPAEAVHQESLLPVWRIRLARAARERLSALAPSVRGGACTALGALRGAGARPEIEHMVGDADPVVTAAAVTALVKLDLTPTELRALGRTDATMPVPVRVAILAALAADDPMASGDPQRACVAFDAATAGMADADFTVRTTAADLLGRLPGGLSCRELIRGYVAADDLDEGTADVRLAVLASLASFFGPDAADRATFLGGCDASTTDDDDPLRTTALEQPHRIAVSALLQQAFADGDLRIRVAARDCAETTELLVPALIPAAASLRETLPAFHRSDIQPAVSPPHGTSLRVRCLSDRGTFVIELDPRAAPNTCATFLHLVETGRHEDLTFHRVVPDFVIQGGCPRGDGWGGPGWTIRSEWSRLPYERGTVGIAHSGKDTGGSQWFVCHSAQPHLNGRYTVFGKVTSGMDVVDRIQRGDHYRLELVVDD